MVSEVSCGLGVRLPGILTALPDRCRIEMDRVVKTVEHIDGDLRKKRRLTASRHRTCHHRDIRSMAPEWYYFKQNGDTPECFAVYSDERVVLQ